MCTCDTIIEGSNEDVSRCVYPLAVLRSFSFVICNGNISLVSQVLTLANGDRVLMTPHMKAFFEPENLNNASPATVSRAGVIYVSKSELGWQPVITSWLQVCPSIVH